METEKRLIDITPLIDECDECMNIEWNQNVSVSWADAEEDFKQRLLDAPVVDAVEVVHGRWEDAHGGRYANPQYRCSVCKENSLYKWERDELGSYRTVQALTPFCPHCMAKLDGDGNAE